MPALTGAALFTAALFGTGWAIALAVAIYLWRTP